jgi:hypothetical protein
MPTLSAASEVTITDVQISSDPITCFMGLIDSRKTEIVTPSGSDRKLLLPASGSILQ